MLEQSSVELENTISDLEEKNDNVEDEGNLSQYFMKPQIYCVWLLLVLRKNWFNWLNMRVW